MVYLCIQKSILVQIKHMRMVISHSYTSHEISNISAEKLQKLQYSDRHKLVC